ncbi:hypothetical protein BXZ70DRAFT_948150 [Cristinia sonorae]|uniref:Uncharacterized protein n=1 Tax=Cristinia sonorae TaxID=1940300 RepID=A0A8K0UIL0_9AGAR|nr:hypothetical protein BXZ70DRAFT_948150 [Cristinia sonorae]
MLNGSSFVDTNVHLYSRRNRAGPFAPRPLALNRRILKAASPEFESYAFSDFTQTESDGYVDDSDLEDEDETDISGSLTVTSLTDSFEYPQTPREEEDITTRLGDADLMTDDEDYRPLPPRRSGPSGSSTPSRRSQTAQSLRDQPRVLDGAFTTWQAMSLYLYTDHIEFNPLRSYIASQPIRPTSTQPKRSPCSPKSMYRLAARLGLEELKVQAQAVLRSYLSEANIVDELFSDFTWRYPEILAMQTEIYYQHCTLPIVTTAMRRINAKIVTGALPHANIVLDALFEKLTMRNGPGA